jgi:ubiquinone/menaquinone biosynthesis C-methylase UbiE
VSHLAAAHPEIDVRLMDIHRLDLPDNSYDLATGGFVIHLVTNPVQVLTELRRVLASRVEALNPTDAAEFRRRSLAELTSMQQSDGIVLDRGATIHLATSPAS